MIHTVCQEKINSILLRKKLRWWESSRGGQPEDENRVRLTDVAFCGRPAKAVHLTLGFPAAQDCVSGG